MNSKRHLVSFTVVLALGMLVGAAVMYIVKPWDRGHTQAVSTVSSDSGEAQLYSCGMHPEVISEEPGNCPICGMKLTPLKGGGSGTSKGKGKILYWRAPMDPTEIYDHPGKSKMGMDLVPVYENEVGSGGIITIDPVTVQNMGVKTAPVEKRNLQRVIRTVGHIDYDERKLFAVNTKISGWIERLYVDYTGQAVKKGDPLLEIYSPELVSTQEEYILALKSKDLLGGSSFAEVAEGAESLLKSTRRRLELWDIPEAEIRRLEETGQVRKTITLTSPANGIVIHKHALDGLFVKEGMDLYTIADLTTVWVPVTVYDYELPWVFLGQEAEMELSYIPGEIFHGHVSYIYPYLDKKARNVEVRLEFPNPDLKLKPDMYVNVRLSSSIGHDALAIPREAVIRSGERSVVFVERDEGKFEPREIRLGPEAENNYVQVLSGLFEGEQVVTSAQFMLDSESRMQEAIQKMMAAKKQLAEHAAEPKKMEEESPVEMEMESAGEVLYTCPMHPEFVTHDPDERCPICEMKLVEKVVEPVAEPEKMESLGEALYTCPMHPEFVTHDPEERCPICEMKLVEKK